MMGMDQSQRSNAVGFNTSYLPDGEGARHGGGTYTGQATEPTIQDYENFFGPSARDIKTDLQRFKRHGRWHLPDILQGPNPWLTDRIDGLITDATNSPFTTKILPYRYKEEVDGKIKWNVWNFDEGMASRVPYESAARTLTQSKRSFAGYMVRQGMAIVLEHNFMMTPKGRENFKNQLNQLIGSIQYTNDLDVHMALILAPSYQKTMRERYYTSDKSPSQVCREFADLFGMMQKNVNALDILIEEGKAILRTWGGPMPDFLLCNSKLTFQMTMTPEKTNYITQGIDGVKRLRQGPDLGSYRGLSVIHSRSFAMETGAHPRDVLRRRVRTAEYYRILPNKKNINREFEFYNEERDTWFTLSFHDLLRYARYYHVGGEHDNASKVDAVYHMLSNQAGIPQASGTGHEQMLSMEMLGAYRYAEADAGNMRGFTNDLRDTVQMLNKPLFNTFFIHHCPIRPGSEYSWCIRTPSNNLGFRFKKPSDNQLWKDFERDLQNNSGVGLDLGPAMKASVLSVGYLKPEMVTDIFLNLKGKPLNDPFMRGKQCGSGTAEWYAAYTFYLEIFKRGGTEFAYVDPFPDTIDFLAAARNMDMRKPATDTLDITFQYLGVSNANGSVNHPFHMRPSTNLPVVYQRTEVGRMTSDGMRVGKKMLLTSNVLAPLLRKYNDRGVHRTGLEILEQMPRLTFEDEFRPPYLRLINSLRTVNFLDFSYEGNREFVQLLTLMLANYDPVDAEIEDDVILARAGVSTIPMYLTTCSHLFHPLLTTGKTKLKQLHALSKQSGGHLSLTMLEFMRQNAADLREEASLASGAGNRFIHPWFWERDDDLINRAAELNARHVSFLQLMRTLRARIYIDPVEPMLTTERLPPAVVDVLPDYANRLPTYATEGQLAAAYTGFIQDNGPGIREVTSDGPPNVVVDLNLYFDDRGKPPVADAKVAQDDAGKIQDVEIVIVRPNIEHNMLGVIMGLGGESLGNTLWGQTELSVYDDSMHGIWGMSYKYHERAIVFNEKNLIRMWDIAYDGYNGGKDDTYVNWLDDGEEQSKYGPKAFKEATLDLSKNYRGPSMMVMAFVHDRAKLEAGSNVYDRHFRRNWPSPIVFYDSGQTQAPEALPIDYDNVQTVDVEEFRVFNNPLYQESYKEYRQMMPEFRSMHLTRKTAGQSSADAETQPDCLAFQGSMRIKEGGIIQEIQGSGHHGPDYVGVASVRAGKGQKVAGQAPAPYRLV
jgi:hypothetical protein